MYSWATALHAWQFCTCAGELLGRCGEQQFVSHITRPGTACNAGLLVAALHPVWQPLHVAVAVQRVGTQSPATQEEKPEESENTLQLWWQEAQQSQHFNLRVLHFRFDELNSSATTKGVTVSILSVWKVHHRWVKCNEWFWCEKHFP